MTVNLQPTLQNEHVMLQPLEATDFDILYPAAADPKTWAQHPNKDRWKKDVFQIFFDGAMESKGAFKIIDKATDTVIGSTRFYDYNAADNCINIGYTFYNNHYWGKGFNPAVKKLMLDYIFQFVDTVHFHIGANNIRSQVAIGRLGAKKIKEQDIQYFGETSTLNFIYAITKADWTGLK